MGVLCTIFARLKSFPDNVRYVLFIQIPQMLTNFKL